MRIGAIAYQPYVYNTNTVSATSLNRIGAIPNDATAGRTDFEELVNDKENVNPLGIGESANFMDILSSQMAMSRTRSAMLFKPTASGEEGAMASAMTDAAANAVADAMQQDGTIGKDAAQTVSRIVSDQDAQQKAVGETLTVGDKESGAAGSSMNEMQENAMSYKMRHALDAYSMAMGMVA